VRHRNVTTDDGAELAAQEAGPYDGPALLLLPGQANSHRWWTGLRESLERTTGRSARLPRDRRDGGSGVGLVDDVLR